VGQDAISAHQFRFACEPACLVKSLRLQAVELRAASGTERSSAMKLHAFIDACRSGTTALHRFATLAGLLHDGGVLLERASPARLDLP